MIEIKVPATTANLGSGFDALGISLSLYNRVYFYRMEEIDASPRFGVEFCENKNNLIYGSAVKLFEICGKEVPKDLRIRQKRKIPITRGLGSSSACIVAGLVGANEFLGSPMNRREILNLATKIEGHPDNVAPALLGGLVSCVYENGKVFYCKQNVSLNIKFMVIVPNFKMSTSKARSVLPDVISRDDAVFNISRSSLFVASMAAQRFENLRVAVDDRIHQARRLKFIDGSEKIFDISYKLGAYAVYLSGSGSSIVAICSRKNTPFVSKMRRELNELGLDRWKILDLSANNNGVVANVI